MIRRFKAIPCILAASAPVLLSIGCRGTGHPARAAQAAPATEASWPVDLLDGHWEGDAWRINSRGTSRFRDHLTVSVDAHGLITAERSWETLDGAGGHRGRTPVKKDVESLIGVFNPHTGEFRLVEMEEPGTISGQVIDENTIVFYSTQPGRQPSTSSERLSRVPAR